MSNNIGRPNHALDCECVVHGGRQRSVPQGGGKYHRPGCQCMAHRGKGYICPPDCECGKHQTSYNRLPLSELLVEDRNAGNGGRIKRRLIDEGLLVDVCSLCGQRPEWDNRPLVLQLDHRNGNPRDWRIENLRVLCPNCHTQTDTFTSRNRRQ